MPLVWYILKGLLSIYRLNPRLIGGEKKEGEKDEEDDEKGATRASLSGIVTAPQDGA